MLTIIARDGRRQRRSTTPNDRCGGGCVLVDRLRLGAGAANRQHKRARRRPLLENVPWKVCVLSLTAVHAVIARAADLRETD